MCQGTVTVIFPVLVVNSQVPPVLLLGTEIRPVSVKTVNTFPLSRLPLILPVVVLMQILLASQLSKVIFPVLRVTDSPSPAITFCIVILPVAPVEVRL